MVHIKNHRVFKQIVVALFTIVLTVHSANVQSNEEPVEMAIGDWMDDWMGQQMSIGGSLHVQRFKDPIYILTKPISWTPSPGQEGGVEVIVPKGFVTDFASIPRIFWSLLRPDGEYTYPAIIHDYLYWCQVLPREKADEIFKLAMEDFDLDAKTIWSISSAVKVAGGTAWNSNTKEKEKGEMRILKKFPQDPRVSWAEWKTQPNVFVSKDTQCK